MLRTSFSRAVLLLVLCSASPAFALENPLNRGPVADFLSIFRQSAVPRQVVAWRSGYAPGTVVISTSQRRLYYVLGHGQAIQYGVGVGRQGFSWTGTKSVTMKREWPDWRPPAQMLRRRPDLPRYMSGGMDNPLGARAMYLGGSLYRIHGSNEPETIGAAVSSGCIRMTNRDVIDLYDRVKVGTKVVVIR
jgi:lipoprotein-anchoring transpeptidase ErfK/SrfK